MDYNRYLPNVTDEVANKNSPLYGAPGRVFKTDRDAVKNFLEAHMSDLLTFVTDYICTPGRHRDFFRKRITDGASGKYGGTRFETYEDGWQLRWPAPLVHKHKQRFTLAVRASGLRYDDAKVTEFPLLTPPELASDDIPEGVIEFSNLSNDKIERNWLQEVEETESVRTLGEVSWQAGVAVTASVEAEGGFLGNGVKVSLSTEVSTSAGGRKENEKASSTTTRRTLSGSRTLEPHTYGSVELRRRNQTTISPVVTSGKLDFAKIEFLMDAALVGGWVCDKRAGDRFDITKAFAIEKGKKRGHWLTFNGLSDLRDVACGLSGPDGYTGGRVSDVRRMFESDARVVLAPRLIVSDTSVVTAVAR